MLRKMKNFMAVFAFVALMAPVPGQAQVRWNYNQAVDIAVDDNGNVYVTGSAAECGNSGLSDWATIKYDSSGKRLWVALYNGPASADDGATAIAIDGSGNVYVSGYSSGIGTGLDSTVIKYDPAGNQLWVARYDGPGKGWDVANDVAVDASGNVYVVGSSTDFPGGVDLLLLKYNSGGDGQWVARYESDYADAGGSELALDTLGNIYVTGYKFGLGEDHNFVTIQYDFEGNLRWVAEYDGPVHGGDIATAIAVNSSGNVFVGGYSQGEGTALFDYVTIKYDSTGTQQWLARENGLGAGDDIISDLALDSSGNVYVTGWYGNGLNWDYGTAKYNSIGQRDWLALYDGPATYPTEFGRAVALDALGNVFVTGTSGGAVITESYDFATVKYNSNGEKLWVARYDAPARSWDEARALALDASGNCYVTGVSRYDGSGADYATIKYSADGVEQWVARYARCSMEAMIEALIQHVQAIDLKNGGGYTGKLEAAMASFQEATSHDYINTINQLEAFKTKCDNDPHLSDADRNVLKNQAAAIIARLSIIN